MKPAGSIGITSASLWLPEKRASAADAVAHRGLRRRDARGLGHETLPESDGTAPPEMAVLAARDALGAAGIGPERLHALGHAWMYYQGHDLWSPAHYIARELGAHRALPFGIQQVCNGGAVAAELMAAYLARPAPSAADRPKWALVTTADRFASPGFDRWTSDYGVAYGDGATALLLHSPAGPGDALVLRSVATIAAPELEGMHRGADPFAAAPHSHRPRVDMRATKRAYLREHGDRDFSDTNGRIIREVMARALDDAGVNADDPRLRTVVLPRFGTKVLNENWIPVISERTRAKIENFGQCTGHLGAGDAAANIAELLRGDRLAPSEMALVFSAGAGFTWSCLVVEAVGRPARHSGGPAGNTHCFAPRNGGK
ncbi:ketoacyl-ACP synthase III family protein [Streptomyces sp. NPDC056796]|uniref:ketoacyl-ACP synthase III family protein n=1 Tax=Streptomyces sp. NPDC056796 TaxID=3345947 RepID=UPI0036C020ED